MQPKPYSQTELYVFLTGRSWKNFCILYDLYAPALFGIICSRIPQRGKAEDILARTFIRIKKSAASYEEGKISLFTWMAGIAIQECEAANLQMQFSGERILENPLAIKIINGKSALEYLSYIL